MPKTRSSAAEFPIFSLKSLDNSMRHNYDFDAKSSNSPLLDFIISDTKNVKFYSNYNINSKLVSYEKENFSTNIYVHFSHEPDIVVSVDNVNKKARIPMKNFRDLITQFERQVARARALNERLDKLHSDRLSSSKETEEVLNRAKAVFEQARKAIQPS